MIHHLSLLDCIVKESICIVITNKDFGKCKYFSILTVRTPLYFMGDMITNVIIQRYKKMYPIVLVVEHIKFLSNLFKFNHILTREVISMGLTNILSFFIL